MGAFFHGDFHSLRPAGNWRIIPISPRFVRARNAANREKCGIRRETAGWIEVHNTAPGREWRRVVTVEQVRDVLTDVLDPELQIDIVNLGMVYDILVEGKDVKITMTLTSMGCPIFDTLKRQIEEKVLALGDVEKVEVELTFDPPWSPDRMSEEARLAMRYMF